MDEPAPASRVRRILRHSNALVTWLALGISMLTALVVIEVLDQVRNTAATSHLESTTGARPPTRRTLPERRPAEGGASVTTTATEASAPLPGPAGHATAPRVASDRQAPKTTTIRTASASATRTPVTTDGATSSTVVASTHPAVTSTSVGAVGRDATSSSRAASSPSLDQPSATPELQEWSGVVSYPADVTTTYPVPDATGIVHLELSVTGPLLVTLVLACPGAPTVTGAPGQDRLVGVATGPSCSASVAIPPSEFGTPATVAYELRVRFDAHGTDQ